MSNVDVRHIGSKEVTGSQMNLGEYNRYRGWLIPADEDPNKDGYLVKYPDGYESWSPAKQFEESYRSSGNYSFGDTLFLLEQGERVARAGWNGKGMYLVLVQPDQYQVDTLFEELPNDPWIGMRTAAGTLVPWLASQTDMLAKDWNTL